MKKMFLPLFATCLFVQSLFGDTSDNWVQYRDAHVRLLPTIHGWCTPEKATRMMNIIHEKKPNVYVEVGVFGGSSFLPATAALAYQKKGVAYAIDPWDNKACIEGETELNADWWSKVDLKMIMSSFIDLMHTNNLDPYYSILRMTSERSVQVFKNNSIDVIHIDGNHSEQSALFDVQNWLPKVKKGGVIIFDDVNWQSTREAVMYLYERCDIDPLCGPNDTYLVFTKR